MENIIYSCPIFILSWKDTGLDGLLVKISTAVTKNSSVTRKPERSGMLERKMKIITLSLANRRGKQMMQRLKYKCSFSLQNKK